MFSYTRAKGQGVLRVDRNVVALVLGCCCAWRVRWSNIELKQSTFTFITLLKLIINISILVLLKQW